jgi:hypothetical protein
LEPTRQKPDDMSFKNLTLDNDIWECYTW